MRNQETLFSSNSCDWATPLDFFQQWDEQFHFDLDVCATPENAKCARYFTREDDGLVQDWTGHVCWMNPPYGRGIINWMRKAYESALGGGRRGVPRSCEDRHDLVARIRHAGRDSFRAWSAEIQRFAGRCALPFCRHCVQEVTP